jgi:hypothetical protein
MAAHEADRFPSINDADLDALLEARDANSTKNVIKYGLRILHDVCVQREILFEEFEQSTKEEMCETLKAFYAAMRSKKGEYYSKKSMVNIRYAIQRHILKLRNFDIVNDLVMFC